MKSSTWIPEDTTLLLEHGRAMLRPMQPSDTAALFAAAADPDIWTYLPARIERIEDMNRVVSTAMAARHEGTEYPFVVVDRTTDRVVGSTRFLDISKKNCSLEIGWTWLAPEARRTSINTECKFLLLRFAFEKLEAVRVQIKTDARNVRSQTAIERIGFVKEGVLRSHRILPDGFIRDSVYYSLVAAEWPAIRERLGTMLGVL